MTETLEQVLEGELRIAEMLKQNGHPHDSHIIDRICRRVAAAAREYLEFVTEREAQLATGHSVEYLRARFPKLEARGLAKNKGRTRSYRYLVLDVRVDHSSVKESVQRAVRGAATSQHDRRQSSGG